MWHFPGESVVQNSPANAGDAGLMPGLGKSSRERNGNPLQYSCLGNSMTEKPGGLQFMGSQKSCPGFGTCPCAGPDLVTKQ